MSKKSRPWSKRQRRAIQRRTEQAQARAKVARQLGVAIAQREAWAREVSRMIEGDSNPEEQAEVERLNLDAFDARMLEAYQRYEEKHAGVLYDDTDDKWDFETKTRPWGEQYFEAKPKPALVEEMKKRREEMARIKADADATVAHIEDYTQRDRAWERVYYRAINAFEESGWDWRAAEKRRGISTEGAP